MNEHARPNINKKRVASYVYLPGPPLDPPVEQHLTVLQRRICHIQSRALGGEIVAEYLDRGPNRDRRQAALRRLRRTDDLDHVVVARLDLLADSPAERIRIADAVGKSRAKLVSASAARNASEFTELLRPLRAELAEELEGQPASSQHSATAKEAA